MNSLKTSMFTSKLSKLRKYWWLFGVLSILLFALCSEIGWYGIANLLVFGGSFYLVKKAEARQKRLLENPKFLLRMSRQQRKAFLELDEQESRNLVSSSLLIFWLNITCLFLDIYTYIFNGLNHRHAAIFRWWEDNNPLNLALFIAGLILGLLYCVAWKSYLNTTKVQFINNKPQRA